MKKFLGILKFMIIFGFMRSVEILKFLIISFLSITAILGIIFFYIMIAICYLHDDSWSGKNVWDCFVIASIPGFLFSV